MTPRTSRHQIYDAANVLTQEVSVRLRAVFKFVTQMGAKALKKYHTVGTKLGQL